SPHPSLNPFTLPISKRDDTNHFSSFTIHFSNPSTLITSKPNITILIHNNLSTNLSPNPTPTLITHHFFPPFFTPN
ncbi:hypothetical protein, partial [Bacillus pumilus]|uniref:hypothetical protein n=1 Tax=Bacillus pumilus TaxID=1408 RepID=UPI001C93186B